MNCLRPEHMSEAEFAHGLRVAQILAQRYPWAKLPDIDTYTYTLDAGGFLTWDITRAKLWVRTQLRQRQAATLELAEVPREELERIATGWDIDEATVERADPTYPGLTAPILDPAQPGVVLHILIDGVHRAVKAYRTGQPFKAIVLPPEVSRDCLLDAPDGSVP